MDGGRHRRTLKPAAPSSEARTWRTLLLLDLEAHPPGEAGAWDSGRGQAILAVTVTAEPTAARTVQFSLLDPAQPSPERLAELMARLHEWTSAGRGGAAALLDTHRPGAFAMEAFAPGRSGGGDRRRGRSGPAAGAAGLPAAAARARRGPRRRAGVRVRGGGGARPGRRSRGAVARVRRLVGRSLEPRGMGRRTRRRRRCSASSTTGLRDAWFVDGELD